MAENGNPGEDDDGDRCAFHAREHPGPQVVPYCLEDVVATWNSYNASQGRQERPQRDIVSPEEFKAARAQLLQDEKAVTYLSQAVVAARRRLPMVKVDDPVRFCFDTLHGEQSLLDLFDGRKQLIIYHVMLATEDDSHGGIAHAFCMDHIPPLQYLHSRDTSFVAVAPAPLQKISDHATRLGWRFPFHSSTKTHQAWKHAEAKGETITWKPGNGCFGVSVFIREEDQVFHTYETSDRGVEAILSTYLLLDMTPLGRQEEGDDMDRFRLPR
ncbi:DUF899-domain-containing protein [Aspergillus indologenus CBS 114.80]|uniref:DUF899-domain-containing protein n=1 Tax=Aspergillus indologenus CBS 114.80 TaxID=1450541 RepID=A0A2V5IL47_9EURO|nr:DUF899-domain-containing protein [Aspergillus indologenus CBS 114.80]